MSDLQSAQRQFATEVVERLCAAGFEAVWAGGCVRDQLLRLPPKDYDVATSARPEQVRELFGRRRTIPVGAAFGVITVLGRRPAEPIEVATFRSDGRYHDGRHPESVEFTDAQHDAQRRDFTINGLFYDPLTDEVIDYVDGRRDLAARLIRAIGDPEARFAEDKLRMLRAIRFAVTYDFAIEPRTLAAIGRMAPEITAVSAERIGAELGRVLTHSNRRRGIELLVESHLLPEVLPELAAPAGAAAAPWLTTLDRAAALGPASLPVALAALLWGTIDPAEARPLARRLRLTNKEGQETEWLLAELPQLVAADQLFWPKLQRLLVNPWADDLLQLATAHCGGEHPGVQHARQQRNLPPAELDPLPLVTGDDLIAAGLSAGKDFRALLEHLRDLQLEGELRSKADALAEARRWMHKRRR